jgi:hypothetical protein
MTRMCRSDVRVVAATGAMDMPKYVIPAKAGIHVELARNGFPLSRE